MIADLFDDKRRSLERLPDASARSAPPLELSPRPAAQPTGSPEAGDPSGLGVDAPASPTHRHRHHHYVLLWLIPLLGQVLITSFALLPLLLVPPVGALAYWLVWKEFHG